MALDHPPSGLDEPLARYLNAIRSEIIALRVKSSAASSSSAQIASISSASQTAANSNPNNTGAPAATALWNLQTSAGLENILLTWQGINQAGYSYTEIWSSNKDDITTATLAGTAIAPVFADNVGSNQSRYYWVRAVNSAEKPGPYNRRAGTFGQTLPATQTILAQLAGAITESQLYTDLQTKIDDSYTGVVTNTTAIAGLDAQYTVKVDVDGYVSGFGLANTLKNDAPFSEFIILADAFAVVFPAQTWTASAGATLGEYIKPTALPTGLYYKVTTAGTLGSAEPAWPTIAGDTVTSGTAILTAVTIASSVPFIVGQVGGVSTVGIDGSLVVDGTIVANAIAAGTITADKMNVAQLSAVAATLGNVIGGTFATGSDPAMRTEISSTGTYLIWSGSGATGGTGAVFYIDNAGNAYFKGTLDAGVINASVLNPGGLLIDCGGGLTTTFVITSTDNQTFYRAKQGTAGAVTLDLGTYYGPTHGTGYYSGRFAFQCMDVSIDFQIDGDWGDVTAKVDVQYDGGAWENIYSFKTDCDYRGGASGSLIYTTKNTAWGTMAVRVTTDGNTQSASGRVTVINLAASTQTPDTVHNTTGDTSDPGYTYRAASTIQYSGGATVDSLKPAEAGADVTGSHYALDVLRVKSDNLVKNGYFESVVGSQSSADGWSNSASAVFQDAATYGIGNNAGFYTASTTGPNQLQGTNKIPVDPNNGKLYLEECLFYASSVAGAHYAGFAEFDVNGAAVSHGSGTYAYPLLAGAPVGAGTKRLWAVFGGNGGASPTKWQFNTAAAYIVPNFLCNWSGTAIGVGIAQVRISEVGGGAQAGMRGVGSAANNESWSYTSNGSSITWSWGAFTVFLSDGSTQGVPAGSKTFSGLSASTTYSFYPYWDYTTSSVQWANNANSAAGTAASLQIQNGPNAVALTPGKITAATTSGGAGGGSTGTGGCLHPDELTDVRIQGDEKTIPASDLLPGMEVWTPDGWKEIRTVQSQYCPEWVHVKWERPDGSRYLRKYSPEQPCYDLEGKMVPAKRLMLDQIVQADGGYVRMAGSSMEIEDCEKIIIGIDEPHLFYQQKGDVKLHNGTVKP